MKFLIALSLMISANAFAANSIECVEVNSKDDEVVVHLKRLPNNRRGEEMFSLTLHQDLATSFASVEDQTVLRDKSASADVLSQSDGNASVEISFRKGFLNAKVGAKSRARVKADYNDIEQDSVSTAVNCEVVQ